MVNFFRETAYLGGFDRRSAESKHRRHPLDRFIARRRIPFWDRTLRSEVPRDCAAGGGGKNREKKSNAIRRRGSFTVGSSGRAVPPGCITGPRHMAGITKGRSPRLRQLSNHVTRSEPLKRGRRKHWLRGPRTHGIERERERILCAI